MTARVIEYDTGMSAINRCDRCGGQAYVEVRLTSPPENEDGRVLLCSHHGTVNWEALVLLDAVIADHRKQLQASEERLKKQPSR